MKLAHAKEPCKSAQNPLKSEAIPSGCMTYKLVYCRQHLSSSNLLVAEVPGLDRRSEEAYA